MAIGAESRLQQVRQLLQEVAKAAPQASAGVNKITEALNAMESRPAPKNIGFAFPKFTEVKQLAEGFKELDTTLAGSGAKLQAWARYAKNVVNEISQIEVNMARAGASIANLFQRPSTHVPPPIEVMTGARLGQVPGVAGMLGARETPRGTQPAQIPVKGDIAALNAEMMTSEALTNASTVALEALNQKYAAMGFSVKEAKATLSANSKELEIQATISKKLAGNLELVAKASEKVSLETMKPVVAVTPVAGLEKLLGTQRFAQFDQQLKKLGLSMGDMKDATVEGANQISRYTFRSEQAGQATRTATFHFDRFGRSLGNMSNRFKGFDQAIAANITKVLRWGIATMVVWGTVRQLNEAFRQLITTQDLLTDLAITTGESMDKMGYYFNRVAAIARETGTDINDAMKAVNIAMRVGEGADEAERIASSFDFLGDAAAYAKLSNLDMAKSSDILIASLKQMGMSITEGDVLLNKWVATSRATNVSMVDLGQAFATTAASADAAGVSIDELNAYIGVFALVTNKSAQESANALRAMFAAIQTPSAQKALEGYGIAVRTASGELRDMPEILEDINVLLNIFGTETERGERALSKMAYVLGGQGARRQADFVSFLKEYNKTRELTNISEGASGELEDALAKKTATLKTAITELKNAFTELAQALGQEGGALTTLTKIVELLTDAIDFFRDLTKSVGPATTAIIAFGAAWAISKQMALGPRIGEALGRGGAGWAGAGMPAGAFGAPAGGAGGGGITQTIGMAGPGLAMAGVHIVQGITGSMEWEEVGIRSGIAIAGAFVGNMLLPGAGGLVGAFIGEAFASKAMERMKDLREDVAAFTPAELEETRSRIKTQVESMRGVPAGLEEIGLPGLETLEKYQARLKEIEAEIAKRGAAPSGLAAEPGGMPAYAARYTQYQGYLDDLEERFTQRRKELPLEFAAGDIGSAREYAATLERMERLANSMLPIFDAMVGSIREQGGAVGNLNDRFVEMGTTMAEWSDESLDFIQTEALAIKQLETDIDALTTAIEGHGDALDHMEQHALDMLKVEKEAAEESLKARLLAFEGLHEGVAKQERIRAYGGIPGFQDYSEFTQAEFGDLIQRAGELQAQFAAELGIPDEVLESIKEWAALAGDSFQWVEGVLQQFVSMAKGEYEELQKSQDEAFNMRRLKDVDPSQMGEIAAANRYWLEYIAQIKGMTAQAYLEMEGAQFNLILGPGNELQQIYSTNEAMLFTLQDILETEKKQLEGMWNIPSGATWFVPITSLFAQEGVGGFPDLGPLIPPTEQTADSTTSTWLSVEQSNAYLEIMASTMTRKDWLTMDDAAMKKMEEIAEIAGRDVPMPDFLQVIRKFEQLREPRERVTITAEEREAAKRVEEPVQRDKDISDRVTNQFAMAQAAWLEQQKKFERVPNRFAIEQETWLKREQMTGGPKVLPAPTEVSVTIPPIDGTFNIQNVVTLDGRIIYAMISKIVARALTGTIRKSGKSNTIPGR